MQKQIYILRHGQTDFNSQGIIQGSGVDSSINALGQRQANAFFAHYSHQPFELVYTSMLQRTHQTVRSFIDKGIPWLERGEINEINWGVHEGLRSTKEMVADYRRLITSWQAGDFDARVKEGESAQELKNRLERFILELRHRSESNILVCCHGRVMRCLICLIDGRPITEMENYKHANTGLYKVAYRRGQFDIVLSNDISHLDQIEKEVV